MGPKGAFTKLSPLMGVMVLEYFCVSDTVECVDITSETPDQIVLLFIIIYVIHSITPKF